MKVLMTHPTDESMLKIMAEDAADGFELATICQEMTTQGVEWENFGIGKDGEQVIGVYLIRRIPAKDPAAIPGPPDPPRPKRRADFG